MSSKAARILLSEKQHEILQIIVKSTTASFRLIQRARIILLSFKRISGDTGENVVFCCEESQRGLIRKQLDSRAKKMTVRTLVLSNTRREALKITLTKSKGRNVFRIGTAELCEFAASARTDRMPPHDEHNSDGGLGLTTNSERHNSITRSFAIATSQRISSSGTFEFWLRKPY